MAFIGLYSPFIVSGDFVFFKFVHHHLKYLQPTIKKKTVTNTKVNLYIYIKILVSQEHCDIFIKTNVKQAIKKTCHHLDASTVHINYSNLNFAGYMSRNGHHK